MSLLGAVSWIFIKSASLWIFIKIHSQSEMVLVLVQIRFSILDYHGMLCVASRYVILAESPTCAIPETYSRTARFCVRERTTVRSCTFGGGKGREGATPSRSLTRSCMCPRQASFPLNVAFRGKTISSIPLFSITDIQLEMFSFHIQVKARLFQVSASQAQASSWQ